VFFATALRSWFRAMDLRNLLTENKSVSMKRKAEEEFLSGCATSENGENGHRGKTGEVGSVVCAATAKRVMFVLGDRREQTLQLGVSAHDPSGAITSTVKDFFDLHDCGVSFTDVLGSVLIITAENLVDGMIVLVNRLPSAEGKKKRRKTMLSARKKSRKIDGEKESDEEDDEDELNGHDSHERRDRNLSSEVSIDNILDSSRRRLSKFSSQVSPDNSFTNLESPIDSLRRIR
jgi:hypothetical protein